VLLLDEPASGLDPRARVEMKELIRELRRMGKTILISSHILPELEELCTWVGFIDGGRMAAAGPMAEVRDAVVSGRRLRISLADHEEEELARAEELLRSHEGVIDVVRLHDHLEVSVAESVVDDDLLALLVRRKVRVRSFAVIPGDLSEVFLRLTRDQMS
jgi:ABC-2 type transport system ATP-binding protein